MLDEPSTSNDQRKLARKTLRTRGTFILSGEAITFNSQDIGLGGLCVLFPQQMSVGQIGRVALTFLINGKRHEVSSAVKVCYCVCGRDGFRTGMQFTETLNQTSNLAINQFLKP